jgi:hypothetical protein
MLAAILALWAAISRTKSLITLRSVTRREDIAQMGAHLLADSDGAQRNRVHPRAWAGTRLAAGKSARGDQQAAPDLLSRSISSSICAIDPVHLDAPAQAVLRLRQ